MSDSKQISIEMKKYGVEVHHVKNLYKKHKTLKKENYINYCLYYSVVQREPGLVKYYIDKGANPLFKISKEIDSYFGPSEIICHSICLKNPEILKFLLTKTNKDDIAKIKYFMDFRNNNCGIWWYLRFQNGRYINQKAKIFDVLVDNKISLKNMCNILKNNVKKYSKSKTYWSS